MNRENRNVRMVEETHRSDDEGLFVFVAEAMVDREEKREGGRGGGGSVEKRIRS